MEPGTRVHHLTMGAGVVQRVLDGGRTLSVTFDVRRNVPYRLPASAFSAVLAEPRRAAPVVARPISDADARQALEALRMGVVPARGLERLTVGRDAEQARLDGLFAAGQGTLLISGPYGSGKTHLVELAEARALAEGFLVARTSFDPEETPPSHPLRVYRALATRIRYPGAAGRGLRPLLDALASRASHATPEGASFHRWLTPALWALEHADEDLADDLVDFVEGSLPADGADLADELVRAGWRGPRMLSLRDYRTFGQILAYLLGGIATWARDAGHRGLVVLLDEAEYLDRLDATARGLAEQVLRYLAVATMPPAGLAFDPAASYRGGHAAHRAVPDRFRPDQPLGVIFAFTPNPEVDRALSRTFAGDGARLDLDPLRPSLFPLLADRVLALVTSAHPGLDAPVQDRHAVRRAMSEADHRGELGTTRAAARLVVEFWDLYRQDPARALAALRT